MRLNKIFNTVNNKERGQSFGSLQSAVLASPPCAQYNVFLKATLFILPLINHCDSCLVPLAWGLMAGGRGFASYRGVTLFKGRLCQKWKPLKPTSTKGRRC